jgi:hypothetical protein
MGSVRNNISPTMNVLTKFLAALTANNAFLYTRLVNTRSLVSSDSAGWFLWDSSFKCRFSACYKLY